MAKIKPGQLFGAIEGMVGDLVIYELNGQLIARRRPQRKAKRTKAEKAWNQKVALAAKYGKASDADPASKAFYASLPHKPGVGTYQLAVRDFLKPPQVQEIDATGYSGKTGDSVWILATDDSGVTQVLVEIQDMTEQVVEKGSAELDEATGKWRYTATKNVPSGQTVNITVKAKDRPGNETSKTSLAYAR